MNALNILLYVLLPYIAVVVCVVGCVYRYRSSGFKFSSLSSQFLDSEKLFFGSLLFHWSILAIFLAHLLLFLFPGWVQSLTSNPANLVAAEMIGFSFGLGALLGLIWLFARRMLNRRILKVTSRMDIVIELLIIAQFIFGCWIALGYRWGSSWFASNLSPYLWSILKLDPQLEMVAYFPPVVLAHIAIAFAILALLPFTRLVHFLVAPFHYIWRPQQVVMWNWNRHLIRNTNGGWSNTRPKNN